MFSTLETFNFGPYFIGLVKTLYEEPLSCVMNCGYTGEVFPVNSAQLGKVTRYQLSCLY